MYPDAEVYEVESIYSTATVNGLKVYLVKWFGYEKPTWEPDRNLSWQMKREFMKEHESFLFMRFVSVGRPRYHQRRRMVNTSRRHSLRSVTFNE